MPAKRQKTQPMTASQMVYNAVREAIYLGEYKVGEHLTEDSVARKYNVSRTPVREAMPLLLSDGFIDVSAHSGAVVRDWSAREVREIFAIRASLESMASGLAAKHANSSDIDRLEELRAAWEMTLWDEPRNIGATSEKNRAFHAGILTISQNDRLERMCLHLMDLGLLAHAFSRFDEDGIRQSMRDHENLVTAISQNDTVWAEALMKAHILAGANKVAGAISEAGG